MCLGSGAFTRWIRVGPLSPLDVETNVLEKAGPKTRNCDDE